MAGLDSFLPGGAGRDGAQLLRALVRNRRRRTATDEALWHSGRTFLLGVLLALCLLWGVACFGSAVLAFSGASTETDDDGSLGLALLVAAVAPAAGVLALLRRRAGQWWFAAGATIATALAMVASDVLQR